MVFVLLIGEDPVLDYFNHLIPTACRVVVLIMPVMLWQQQQQQQQDQSDVDSSFFGRSSIFCVSFGFDSIMIIPFGSCVGVASKMPSRVEFLTNTTASFVLRHFLDLR